MFLCNKFLLAFKFLKKKKKKKTQAEKQNSNKKDYGSCSEQ